MTIAFSPSPPAEQQREKSYIETKFQAQAELLSHAELDDGGMGGVHAKKKLLNSSIDGRFFFEVRKTSKKLWVCEQKKKLSSDKNHLTTVVVFGELTIEERRKITIEPRSQISITSNLDRIVGRRKKQATFDVRESARLSLTDNLQFQCWHGKYSVLCLVNALCVNFVLLLAHSYIAWAEWSKVIDLLPDDWGRTNELLRRQFSLWETPSTRGKRDSRII